VLTTDPKVNGFLPLSWENIRLVVGVSWLFFFIYFFISDHLFGPDSSNREVFEVLVRPIVQSAVHGFNGTIFAYGQTSSGM